MCCCCLQVGHYIGQGCNIILCLQQLPDGCTIEGEQVRSSRVMTSQCVCEAGCQVHALQLGSDRARVLVFQLTDYAVKDYNRARAYLCDLANRDKIPVFDDVTEAVNCAVATLKGRKRGGGSS